MDSNERTELLNYIRYHERQADQYRALLERAEVYVRAYTCQCDAPGRVPGARALLKDIDAALD